MGKKMHPTREKLLMTTVALLDSENPERIGQELVLAESGVSKGSMYHHFQDFPEVVEAALVYRFHRSVDESIASIDAALSTASTREEFFEHVAAITRATQGPERAATRFERARALGMAGNSERFRAALGVEQQRLTDAMADVIARAQELGWVAPEVDARALAVFLQAYTLGKVVDDITDTAMSEDAWIALIVRILDTALI